ncbi:MAG: hypothetical protein ACREMZ_15055 [Gemmatimonadales bacterium]
MNNSWVQLLSALLTPTIAVLGAVLAVLNHLHLRRKRKDDLFDRRYAFYKRVRDWWLTTGTGAAPDTDPDVDTEDLIPIAEEAEFLFGKDVGKHILSLDRSGHSGSPFFPNSDFTGPFEKHLRL